MKQFADYLAVKVDKLFEDHVQFGGKDGRQVYFDPSFEPGKHVRKYGEVVEVPVRLGKAPLPIQINQGTPAPYEHAPTQFKYLHDIEPEVEVGDRVYFHHSTVMDMRRNMIREEGEHPNRTWYFRVRYDQVFCAVREISKLEVDEKLTEADPEQMTYRVIIPIGSTVLVQPDWEEWKDILRPTYTTLKDKHGKLIPKPESQWLQTKVAPGYKHLTGYVRHVGSPFKDDLCEVMPGDKIVYRPNADYLTEIEGIQYFVIKQRHILGVLTGDAKIT